MITIVIRQIEETFVYDTGSDALGMENEQYSGEGGGDCKERAVPFFYRGNIPLC